MQPIKKDYKGLLRGSWHRMVETAVSMEGSCHGVVGSWKKGVRCLGRQPEATAPEKRTLWRPLRGVEPKPESTECTDCSSVCLLISIKKINCLARDWIWQCMLWELGGSTA